MTTSHNDINPSEVPVTPETPKGGLNNLQLRLIAGILGSAFVFTSIYLSEWAFGAIFLLLVYLAQKEFYDLLKLTKKKPNAPFGVFIGMLVYILVFLIQQKTLDIKFYILLLPLCASIFIYEMYVSKKKPFNNVAYTFLGVIYVAVPIALMPVIAFFNGHYEFKMVLPMLVLLWASDTGAYFAGKTLGKTPLFPRISPKKTWEGSIGGLILSQIFAYLLYIYFPILPYHKYVIISGLIVVFGSYGDLVESSFKRSLKIKDSGTLIPGHGGMLDRFDGLLLSTPFVVAYLLLFP
jgi:phosphatidate cytidylyltransferase